MQIRLYQCKYQVKKQLQQSIALGLFLKILLVTTLLMLLRFEVLSQSDQSIYESEKPKVDILPAKGCIYVVLYEHSSWNSPSLTIFNENKKPILGQSLVPASINKVQLEHKGEVIVHIDDDTVKIIRWITLK